MLDQIVAKPRLPVAALDVADLAARCAVGAEANRRLAPAVVDAVLEAGFARHLVPDDWGGAAGTFGELTRAVAIVGEACASSAWYASLTASVARMGAYLPVQGQAEVWAEGPDALIVGALMPLGTAVPVDGGWKVSGRWPFVSAVDFSDWALVCAMTTGEDPSEARFFGIPRTAYAIEDTWFNVGMRATGSNTLRLDDVPVPAHRSFTRAHLADGDAANSRAACHSVPLKAVNGLSFAAPVLGAARGALACWTGYMAQKIASDPVPRVRGAGNYTSSYQTVARSAGEIDAAQLLLERAADSADRGALTPLQTAQNSRDCALAADLLVSSVDRLFREAGTSGQSSTSAIQRFWRDVHSAASHIVLNFEPAAVMYGTQILGP